MPTADKSGRTIPLNAAPARVAVVGCGRRFSSSVAPALRESRAQVVLAVDPDPDALRRVTGQLPHSPAPTLAARLTTERLMETEADAVVISSPSGLHFEHCQIALSCGLPTFVEKPLACTAADAVTLLDSANGLLAASEQRRHRADLIWLRTTVGQGHLGQISEVRYYDAVAPTPDFASSWRNDPELAGGGILLDLGYHTAGSLQWLLGLRTADFDVTDTSLTTDCLHVETAAQISCVARQITIGLDIRHSQEKPREVVIVRGSLGTLRLDRPRTEPSAATFTLSVRDREPVSWRHRLNDRSDSQSLREFLSGDVRSRELGRHVDTLKFLELAYHRSTGGKGATDGAFERLG